MPLPCAHCGVHASTTRWSLFVANTLTSMTSSASLTAFGDVLENPTKPSFVTSVGEIPLHFDHWLVGKSPVPTSFTMLYAIEAPPGSDTVFASSARAYERLAPSLQQTISKMSASHCFNYSSEPTMGPRVRAADLPPGQPTSLHPLVRPHPETGTMTLYVSPRNTDCVVDLGIKESDILVDTLVRHLTAPDNVYAHAWEAGDLLAWDNHALVHGRKAYDGCQSRRLRRLCIR